MDQLEENITAFNTELSKELIIEINDILKEYPVPF